MGRMKIWKFSVLSAHFFCKPNAALKLKTIKDMLWILKSSHLFLYILFRLIIIITTSHHQLTSPILHQILFQVLFLYYLI